MQSQSSSPPSPTPKVTLRMVIGALSAFTVVLVASATFAITYTQSLASVDDAGRRYSLAIVSAANIHLSAFFDTPARMGLGIQRLLQQSWNRLPSEDPTNSTVVNRTAEYLMVTATYNPALMATSSVLFIDGSSAYALQYPDRLTKTASVCWPSKGCLNINSEYNPDTMAYLSPPTVDFNETGLPVNTGLINGAISTLAAIPAFWSGVLAFQLRGRFFYGFPPVFAVRNATKIIGVLAMPIYVDVLTDFLKNLTTTANSYTFVADNLDTVIATNYPVDYTVFKPKAQATQTNCATDAQANSLQILPCRPFVATFPWQPLADAAKNPQVLTPGAGTLFVDIMTSGGTRYFVAAAGVANRLALFKMTVILLMPDTDILGDIYVARNTVLIIVAVILVVSSAMSFAFTSALLKPLHRVAMQMRHTSKLKEVADDGELSAFAEIHHLQRAYQTMNTAIKNFTRYVPRDVVKDLMSTGQLCEISMNTMYCSMLFVDIAGFTNMCERVPADELSKLVRSYFETMSHVIMTQGGLIDKFIGDAIMAVWGAPFFVSSHEVKATLAAFLIDRSSQTEPLASAFDAAGEQLSVRVGVATGHVLAGNMGSADRMNYTVIGDAVNLAAREESMNKQFGTRVMIEHQTAACAAPFFVLRKLMRVAVVGKADVTTVFEVVGLRAPAQRDAAAVEALRVADHNAKLANDNASAASASVISDVSAERGVRDTLTTLQMLDAAAALTGTIVEAQRATEAEAYTAAATALEHKDWAGCLATLKRLEDQGSLYGLDKASELMRRVAHDGMATRDGSHDGVMRATEK